MKQFRFLLMLTLLFVGLSSYAQTVVEFVAGVDKGTNTKFKTIGDVADEVTKDGVKMHSNNATFATNEYVVNKKIINKTLAFSSSKKITKIQFVGGEKLTKLSVNGFNAETGEWTGEATEVSMTVSGEVKFSKVLVTLFDKCVTTLKFDKDVNTLEIGATSKFAAELTAPDADMSGKTITYTSENPDIASVDADGTVKGLALGAATIKATFAGDDEAIGSETSYTLYVVRKGTYFYESFNKMEGRGGNDGQWNFLETGTHSNTQSFDNSGWTDLGAYAYKASSCLRLEMSASATTPALTNLSGDAFLYFRAGQNRGMGTGLELSISGGGTLPIKKVSLTQGEFTDFIVPVVGATPDTKITFACSAFGCLFLDEVRIERAIYLDDNAEDNSDKLSANNGEMVNVALSRNFSTAYWNTICLPFNFDKSKIDAIFGEGTELKAFDRQEGSTLYFKDAESIVSGQPYLLKPTTDQSLLMLVDTELDGVSGPGSVSGTGSVAFNGTFNATRLLDTDVFFNTDNKLTRPDTAIENANLLKGFRAYFSGILGDVASAQVSFDDVVTSIDSIDGGAQFNAGKVYTIDGQYIGTTTAGLKKGIYIVGNKKVVVK